LVRTKEKNRQRIHKQPMPKYTKLILFDCQDGRTSWFDDISVFQQLPSNCECCLFWNKNNHAATVKFNQLRTNPRVYLYPSELSESDKSAIDNLIYVIDEYVYWYYPIIIVHGHDDIYNEVIQNLNVQALQELFTELGNQKKKPKHAEPKPFKTLPPKAPVSRSSNIFEQSCLKCARKFKDVDGLSEHNKAKHQPNSSVYICACSFKCSTQLEFNRHQREKREIVDNQGVITCLNTDEPVEIYLTPDSVPLIFLDGKMNACVFKCHRRWFTPSELFRHLKGQHANEINIRIRCCDDRIMYTLDEFRAHIESQHTRMNIQ
jgi:hypothetical protein